MDSIRKSIKINKKIMCLFHYTIFYKNKFNSNSIIPKQFKLFKKKKIVNYTNFVNIHNF